MNRMRLCLILVLMFGISATTCGQQMKSNKVYNDPFVGVDSIEIKLIDWNVVHRGYFAVERAYFDRTYDCLSLSGDSLKYELVHFKTGNKITIDLITAILNTTLEPFPSDGVFVSPNQAMRNSKKRKTDTGIIMDKNLTDDPLEIRGKMTIYIKENRIELYISYLSIDIFNNRYRIGQPLYHFLNSLTK